jgi:hypothetical protein
MSPTLQTRRGARNGSTQRTASRSARELDGLVRLRGRDLRAVAPGRRRQGALVKAGDTRDAGDLSSGLRRAVEGEDRPTCIEHAEQDDEEHGDHQREFRQGLTAGAAGGGAPTEGIVVIASVRRDVPVACVEPHAFVAVSVTVNVLLAPVTCGSGPAP